MTFDRKAYHQTASQQHYENNRDAYLAKNKARREATKQILIEAKADGCIKCGEKYEGALDFHHLGDKDMVVSSMLGMNEQRVRAEIRKCVVLCKNCHAKVHGGVLDM